MTATSNAEAFLESLDEYKISHTIEMNRPGALMISFATPGYRWEIEFFDDGTIELERFVSEGVNGVPDVRAAIAKVSEVLTAR